ncbi:MAG: NAD(P)/FAD-dependent oxidoreductase [Dehalococcoidia bacterium]
MIIVGAGPAGNAAAWKLADLGYEVVVLESRERIGAKLCTGIVGRECLERYSAVEPRVYRKTGATSLVLPSGRTVRLDMERPYAYVIDRVHFVDALAQMAEKAGAVYARNRRVTGVGAGEQGVWARTVANGTEEIYRGEALLLASGFGSRFTKALGLGSIGDFVLGAQAEVTTNGLREMELYLGRRFAPGFFGWLVPTFDGRGLVGLLTRREPTAHLGRLISTLQSQGRITEVTNRPSKWGIPLKPLPRTFGDRVLAVGDAAGQVKPTTGGGIYYSLLCAEQAAETLHRAFQRNDLSARQLGYYEARWKAKLGRELRVGFYARRLYEALPDRQMERLMDSIAHNGVHRDVIQDRQSSFDWHADLILKGMAHQAIRSVINPLKSLIPSLSWSRDV